MKALKDNWVEPTKQQALVSQMTLKKNKQTTILKNKFYLSNECLILMHDNLSAFVY